jgi:predicted homoserine dehydrogenase-like protein
MWIVDTELKAREEQSRPIRVGIVGAGFMGQGLTNQIVHSVAGMRVVAISNRQVERAVSVFKYAGCEDVVVTDSQRTFDDAAIRLQPVATEDAMLLARSEHIDVLVDVTVR